MIGHPRRAGAIVLLVVDGLLDYPRAAPAVFARPPNPDPARRREFFLKGLALFELLGARRNHRVIVVGLEILGQVRLQPVAQLHPVGFLLGAVFKIHRRCPSVLRTLVRESRVKHGAACVNAGGGLSPPQLDKDAAVTWMYVTTARLAAIMRPRKSDRAGQTGVRDGFRLQRGRRAFQGTGA